MFAKLKTRIRAFEELHGGQRNLEARELYNGMVSREKFKRRHSPHLSGGGDEEDEDEEDERGHLESILKQGLRGLALFAGSILDRKQIADKLLLIIRAVVVFWNSPDIERRFKYAYAGHLVSYVDHLGYFATAEPLFTGPFGSRIEDQFHTILRALTADIQSRPDEFKGGDKSTLASTMSTFLGGMPTKRGSSDINGSNGAGGTSKRVALEKELETELETELATLRAYIEKEGPNSRVEDAIKIIQDKLHPGDAARTPARRVADAPISTLRAVSAPTLAMYHAARGRAAAVAAQSPARRAVAAAPKPAAVVAAAPRPADVVAAAPSPAKAGKCITCCDSCLRGLLSLVWTGVSKSASAAATSCLCAGGGKYVALQILMAVASTVYSIYGLFAAEVVHELHLDPNMIYSPWLIESYKRRAENIQNVIHQGMDGAASFDVQGATEDVLRVGNYSREENTVRMMTGREYNFMFGAFTDGVASLANRYTGGMLGDVPEKRLAVRVLTEIAVRTQLLAAWVLKVALQYTDVTGYGTALIGPYTRQAVIDMAAEMRGTRTVSRDAYDVIQLLGEIDQEKFKEKLGPDVWAKATTFSNLNLQFMECLDRQVLADTGAMLEHDLGSQTVATIVDLVRGTDTAVSHLTSGKGVAAMGAIAVKWKLHCIPGKFESARTGAGPQEFTGEMVQTLSNWCIAGKCNGASETAGVSTEYIHMWAGLSVVVSTFLVFLAMMYSIKVACRVGVMTGASAALSQLTTAAIGAALGAAFGPGIGESVGGYMGESAGGYVGESVGGYVGDSVGLAVGSAVGLAVGSTVGAAVRSVANTMGQANKGTPRAE